MAPLAQQRSPAAAPALRASSALRGSRVAAVPAVRRAAARRQETRAAAGIDFDQLTKPATPVSTPPTSRDVCAIILGGGKGSRLYPLTQQRAKPAVPIGGAYRLIDVPMSNCLNSGINKVYILTQFNSTSLNRHLARTYNFGNGIIAGGDAFVEVLAATQTPSDKDWFRGTADAVRQYAWLFTDVKNSYVKDVVILSGDHLYRMDYMKFVAEHRANNADITIGVLPCEEERAADFGLMKIDDKGRVTEFAEKPKGDALKAMQVDTTVLGLPEEEAKFKPYIASMGIYVFNKEVLVSLLTDKYPDMEDFGGEIIPAAAPDLNVMAYLHNSYWEDIGTIKSFFNANLNLAKEDSDFDFYDATSPIYTSPRFLPPAQVNSCTVKDSIISHGCFVEDSSVANAIIGLRSRIEPGCTIDGAMVMGADFYESEEERAALLAAGQVPVGIGAGSVIKNAIVDKNGRVGKNCQIINAQGITESDQTTTGGYFIRDGIVTTVRNWTFVDGTII